MSDRVTIDQRAWDRAQAELPESADWSEVARLSQKIKERLLAESLRVEAYQTKLLQAAGREWT
jgi:hypothetical protein